MLAESLSGKSLEKLYAISTLLAKYPINKVDTMITIKICNLYFKINFAKSFDILVLNLICEYIKKVYDNTINEHFFKISR